MRSHRTLCLLTLLATSLVALLVHADDSDAEPIPALRPLTADDSILIVSPHPDDESLCCGGLMATANRIGARVSSVWVTNGDGFRWDAMVVEKPLLPRAGSYRELALQREGEARAAAGILGVAPQAQYFLGYPDRG